MMASGLPLVELERRQRGLRARRAGRAWWSWPSRGPTRSPTRSSGSSTTARRAAAMARRARAFVEERTWERAGDQVEAALFDFFGRPRS